MDAVQQTVLDQVNLRSTALVQGDKATIDTLFVDTYIYTNAHGDFCDKATYLEFYVGSEQMVWESQTISESQVWIYGDTAIVNCLVHDIATYAGALFDAHYRTTHTLLQQQGKWQFIASHTSSIVTP